MAEPLARIGTAFVCDRDCPRCLGTGTVCENHPDQAWQPLVDAGRGCSCGAGMPCRPENRTELEVIPDGTTMLGVMWPEEQEAKGG